MRFWGCFRGSKWAIRCFHFIRYIVDICNIRNICNINNLGCVTSKRLYVTSVTGLSMKLKTYKIEGEELTLKDVVLRVKNVSPH